MARKSPPSKWVQIEYTAHFALDIEMQNYILLVIWKERALDHE
jgi:hypothetical protein